MVACADAAHLHIANFPNRLPCTRHTHPSLATYVYIAAPQQESRDVVALLGAFVAALVSPTSLSLPKVVAWEASLHCATNALSALSEAVAQGVIPIRTAQVLFLLGGGVALQCIAIHLFFACALVISGPVFFWLVCFSVALARLPQLCVAPRLPLFCG